MQAPWAIGLRCPIRAQQGLGDLSIASACPSLPWSFRTYQGRVCKHQGFISPSVALKNWEISRTHPDGLLMVVSIRWFEFGPEIKFPYPLLPQFKPLFTSIHLVVTLFASLPLVHLIFIPATLGVSYHGLETTAYRLSSAFLKHAFREVTFGCCKGTVPGALPLPSPVPVRMPKRNSKGTYLVPPKGHILVKSM